MVMVLGSYLPKGIQPKDDDVSMRWTKRTEWDSKIKSQRDN